jgi:protein subunit release factor B
MLRAVHPARQPLELFVKSCVESHVRRSGPGGQHRNRVATGVVLTHSPTNISAEATERRSQLENKVNAIHRLRIQLALQVRLPCDAARWAPSDMLRQR